MRDNTSNSLCGIYGSIGVPEITHVELLAILHGITMCREMGIRKLVCFSDFLHALHLIREGNLILHRHENEITIIRAYINKDWDCKLLHTLGEGNHCTRFLARLGAHRRDSVIYLSSPSSDLMTLIKADALGTEFVRL